jgi:16S rRNA (cytosine967-C5)-methyltransferase
VRIVCADAARRLPFGVEFDRVLIDAPCSGLGTLRRDPDIKWRRTEDELESLSALQARILDAAALVLRPGGRLLYSTCSSEPEENEEVIAAFLERRPDFDLHPVGLTCAPQLVNGGGFLHTLPFRDGLEGFFAGQLVKAPRLR